MFRKNSQFDEITRKKNADSRIRKIKKKLVEFHKRQNDRQTTDQSSSFDQ